MSDALSPALRSRRALWCLFIAALLSSTAAAQDLTAEQQATMLLDAGRRAFNEKQYAFAAEQFRKFLQMYGGHKDAATARYGLGLTIIDGPAQPNLPGGIDRDYAQAIDQLRQAAGAAGFAEKAFAVYYIAVAQRAMGQAELALGEAAPTELPQRRQNAANWFDQAAKQFAEAIAAFDARAKAAPAPADGSLPADVEWAARARCDQAEMLLRNGKAKEAQPIVEAVFKDAKLSRTQSADLAKYYFGYAAHLQMDYLVAARHLAQLAPFKNPTYGVHARYLLARTHHMANERPEAQSLYESLLADHDAAVATAKQQLQNPAQFAGNPRELERLKAIAAGAAPEHVERAWFYLAVLLTEQGKFADAAERFVKFQQMYPKSPLLTESQVRLGFCQLRSKANAEAVKTLGPLQDHAEYGYQSRWWIARATVASADPANAQAVQQALAAAIQQFRVAADRANQKAAADPDAKLARADILTELADALILSNQPREAATIYAAVIAEKADADLIEQAMQRMATALHLAKAYGESDAACNQFVAAYPRSVLMPAVLFRFAENAFAQAEAAYNNVQNAQRLEQSKPLYAEAIKRYTPLLEKHPDFESIALARYALGSAYYRSGDYEKAAATLAKIEQADRTGPLASVWHMQADCLIRTAPTDTSDALSAGKVLQQINEAAKLLEAFIAANDQHAEIHAAIFKLGDCYQRVGVLMADPAERTRILIQARTLYEAFKARYPEHPMMPAAELERANCFVLLGDPANGASKLVRFQTQEPYASSKIAPLALLRLASLQRAQGQINEAVATLTQARQKYEAGMLADAERKAWVPLLQYHHALAIKESGKVAEALPIFVSVTQQFAAAPEAIDAAWRAGQCRQDLAKQKLAAAQAALNNPATKPEDAAKARSEVNLAIQAMRETGQYFESQAGPIGQKAGGSESHLRMFYEAAWCYRTIGDLEAEAARQALKEQARKKLEDATKAATPQGQPAPAVNAPEVALAQVPWQPAQQRAQEMYQTIVKTSGDAPLAVLARFELAEMHAQRDAFDAAIPLLTEAFELEPPVDLAERVQLRLGSVKLAKGDVKGAAEQFAQLVQSKNQATAAEAKARLGEAKLQANDFNGAIQMLLPFRDQDPWKNIAGVADRAMLRLGHAQAAAGQWDQSRASCEAVVQRFGNSPWRYEARYGMGWALQNQKNYDGAIAQYREVVKATGAEVAARAYVQMGLCLLEKKQWAEASSSFLTVIYTYDYPQWTAAALVEVARAQVELKQPDAAKASLNRVIKDYPTSSWAKVAQQRLAEIK